MTYEARWYECDVVDGFEADIAPPDFSRVPEAKREQVRARFEVALLEKAKPTRWLMWGPQIPWYQRQPQYRVTVHG